MSYWKHFNDKFHRHELTRSKDRIIPVPTPDHQRLGLPPSTSTGGITNG